MLLLFACFFLVLSWFVELAEYWWVFVICIVVGVVLSLKEDNAPSKKDATTSPRQFEVDFDDHDDDFFSRKPASRKGSRSGGFVSSFDDHEETDSFIDKDGFEHTVDYDGYCDECDDYHEE